MKKTDQLRDLRGLSVPDLKERCRSVAEELMKLRFRVKTGQLEQTHRIPELRAELARARTVLGEKAAEQA